MSEHIVASTDLFNEVFAQFGEIHISSYKFRKLFSRRYKLFFDCDGEPNICLENVLRFQNYPRFVAYFIVRNEKGELSVMDVSYSNLGKETMEHFINRYPGQLKPANVMALQLSGLEYVDYIGASYEDE